MHQYPQLSDFLCLAIWLGLGREENEDLAWPGFLSTSMRGYQNSPETDYPVIRKEDFENHNKDGGLWVIMKGKVTIVN